MHPKSIKINLQKFSLFSPFCEKLRSEANSLFFALLRKIAKRSGFASQKKIWCSLRFRFAFFFEKNFAFASLSQLTFGRNLDPCSDHRRKLSGIFTKLQKFYDSTFLKKTRQMFCDAATCIRLQSFFKKFCIAEARFTSATRAILKSKRSSKCAQFNLTFSGRLWKSQRIFRMSSG